MAASKPLSPVVGKSSATIGEHLATWRRIQGITSAELASRASVSRETISRIEHGDPSVGFGKVLSVCRVLGIMPQVVFAFDPASTEYGRLRLTDSLPKRVRK